MIKELQKETKKIDIDALISEGRKTVIAKEKINKAKQCLIDNGIDKEEAGVVLQALCYILLDEETE